MWSSHNYVLCVTGCILCVGIGYNTTSREQATDSTMHWKREIWRYVVCVGIAYRVAYLLLPLQDVGNGMIGWELHLAVKHHWLAQDCGDVHGILETAHHTYNTTRTYNNIVKTGLGVHVKWFKLKHNLFIKFKIINVVDFLCLEYLKLQKKNFFLISNILFLFFLTNLQNF